MKTIRNSTPAPLRVPLPGGKTLYLGPGRTGQISDKAADHTAVRKLLDAGRIEIVDGESAAPSGETTGSRPAHGSTHGHAPPTTVVPKGDR